MESIFKDNNKKKQYRYLAFFCIGLVVLVAAMSGIKMMIGKSMGKKFAPPASSVASYVTATAPWQNNLEITGSLKSINGAVLSTETAGIISKVNFDAGAAVKAGDVLLELEHQLEKAQMETAEAENKLAQNELVRAEAVFAVGGVSKSELEQAQSNAIKAKAEVKRLTAIFEKRIIKAPFDGKVGVRNFNSGEFLNAGQAAVSVFNDQQLYLNFSVPENYSAEVLKDKEIKFTLSGAEDTEYSAKIHSSNPDVDANTRLILVQALVDQKLAELKSGMYVKVKLPIGAETKPIIIPATAIKHAPYGDSVFVLTEQKNEGAESVYIPEERTITIGGNRGNQSAVIKGLKEGETIAANGVFKIIAGMPLKINNEIPADINISPKPENN